MTTRKQQRGATTRRSAQPGGELEQAASQVLTLIEKPIPDFLRDAVIDALHEAAEITGAQMPTFDIHQESAGERVKMLAELFSRTHLLSLRAPDKSSRPALTAKAAAQLAEGIVQSADFDDEVIWQLIVLLDEIAESCMDATRVEDLTTAARDCAFSLTFEFNRACDAQIAKRRAQWAKNLFAEK